MVEIMRGQRGAALVVSLVLLIMVLLLGVSAAQLCLQGEKAARAERDREVALLTAEDALADAEREIRNSSDPSRRAAFEDGAGLVDGEGAEAGGAFGATCGAGGVGLRLRAAVGEKVVWQVVDLSGAEDGGACTVTHGAYTAAVMPTGEGFLPFKKPRYLIERMECHQPGDDASAGAKPHYCYRVTAIGFGARPGTEVVVQSVFSKPEEKP
ncbi:type IV pilus assembly protein PilX [Duganella sp. 1224]|uniref:pilus assembly PilX family protein n=1 Tax=Duganella sp. 1224 TaxID=2587052 RepID=UPI0017DA5DAE|nr:pilus assembly protein [Duganella sp. 1224]NYE61131.1 type IV pilus assembly protein PilX [Duganella sp. 1224]